MTRPARTAIIALVAAVLAAAASLIAVPPEAAARPRPTSKWPRARPAAAIDSGDGIP